MLLQINTDEAFGSGNNPAYRRKERLFILWLPHIPIKTRKLHFQACGVNVIYRVERDRWWSENLMWQQRAMLPLLPVQWRNSPQTV